MEIRETQMLVKCIMELYLQKGGVRMQEGSLRWGKGLTSEKWVLTYRKRGISSSAIDMLGHIQMTV